MNQKWLLLIFIFLIAVAECVGQSCLRSFYNNPNRIWLILLGILFYSIVCVLLVFSYKYKGMGLVNVLWSGLSVLVIVSTGMLFFNEQITRLDWLGIGLIILGIAAVLAEGGH